eukprot:tig00000788_g4085.t1
MKRGADPKRHPARLAIDLSDDESPPKRRSTSHLPGVPVKIAMRDPPERPTLKRMGEMLAEVRAEGERMLRDERCPLVTVTFAGTERPVRVVRMPPEALRTALAVYAEFHGPAPRRLRAGEIERLLAFRLPKWAARQISDAPRNPRRPQWEEGDGPVRLAFELKDGTCHFWNDWNASEARYPTILSACWNALMREAIEPETSAFYRARKSAAARLTCEGCGAAEGEETFHVDHMGPAYFTDILFAFCRSRCLTRKEATGERAVVGIRARPPGPGEKTWHPLLPVVVETDPPFLTSLFADYHRAYPKTLRILCKGCNSETAKEVTKVRGRYEMTGGIIPGEHREADPPSQWLNLELVGK